MEDNMENIETQTTHPIWQHFSKRTLLLILVLIAITGGLLYLAVKEEQPSPTLKTTSIPTPAPIYTTLTLIPQTASNSAFQIVDVIVKTNGNKLTTAQLNLSYDPKILTNLTIKPGTFFQNPNVLFNTVDKVNGRISYVLAIQPSATQPSGNGTIANITYSLAPTTESTTKLSFLPKTEITQQGILGSVLKSTKDLTITIPESLQLTPTAAK